MEGDDGPSAIGNKPTVIKGNRYVDYYIFMYSLSSHHLEIIFDLFFLCFTFFTLKELRCDFILRKIT